MTRQNLFYEPVYFYKTTITEKSLEPLLKEATFYDCVRMCAHTNVHDIKRTYLYGFEDKIYKIWS